MLHTPLLAASIALLTLVPPARQEAESPGPEPAAPPPRLVVLVTLGPVGGEELERLSPWLEGGLARFRDEGRLFPAAELDYAITQDAPGAATIATGRFPSAHGIVAESFLERAASQERYATHDPGAMLLAPGGVLTEPVQGGPSPAHLLAWGAADLLRAVSPASRAISIGGDPDPVVLLPGRRPDWALWWDRRAGGFTSSSWYGEELPGWVLAWNEEWSARASGHRWEPLVAELAIAGFDDPPEGSAASGPRLGSSDSLGDAPSARSYQSLAGFVRGSPLADRFAVDLALEAVRELELGAREATDLLCLALWSCDVIAHRLGPNAPETADAILRADRELGRLFTALDERVGRGEWVAALASTSGILDLPERLRARGVGARRIPSSESRRALAVVRERLQERFGSFFGAAFPGVVLALDAPSIERAQIDAMEVRELARAALVGAGDWIAGAYTLEELAGMEGDPNDPWLALYRRSYHPGRAPDVAVRPQPWTLVHVHAGTHNGSPYPYDRRVLLGFLGPGVAPGRSYERVGPQDVVPTLFALLGLELPEGLDGRALDLGAR